MIMHVPTTDNGDGIVWKKIRSKIVAKTIYVVMPIVSNIHPYLYREKSAILTCP